MALDTTAGVARVRTVAPSVSWGLQDGGNRCEPASAGERRISEVRSASGPPHGEIAMPHSYSNIVTHIVFSTKSRRPFIDTRLDSRLFPYFGGIVRQLGGKLYVVNGVEDHVHLLAELPPTIAIAEAIGKIKCGSTYWIHQSFPEQAVFAWQRGYAAFSVSKSNIAAVARYIEGQKEHHKKHSFQDEFLELLRRHGVAINEKYLWT
jgi:putative transposase